MILSVKCPEFGCSTYAEVLIELVSDHTGLHWYVTNVDERCPEHSAEELLAAADEACSNYEQSHGAHHAQK